MPSVVVHAQSTSIASVRRTVKILPLEQAHQVAQGDFRHIPSSEPVIILALTQQRLTTGTDLLKRNPYFVICVCIQRVNVVAQRTLE